MPFLLRIIENPKLARYVHSLDLKKWTSLLSLDPQYGDPFDQCALSLKEYYHLAEAARVAGLISTIRKYGHSNNITDRANAMIANSGGCGGMRTIEGWYDYLFEPDVHLDNVSYENNFCQLLQAGLEDPLFVLLIS